MQLSICTRDVSCGDIFEYDTLTKIFFQTESIKNRSRNFGVLWHKIAALIKNNMPEEEGISQFSMNKISTHARVSIVGIMDVEEEKCNNFGACS